MGVTSASTNDDAGREPSLSRSAASVAADSSAEAPTRQLVSAMGGDRCVTCEAPLASDQRYCLNCGERRGRSGYTAASAAMQSAATPPAAAAAASSGQEPPSARRRVASGTTLVAGIATLLLAMGVGVEIGRISSNGNTGSQARASAPPVQVVTVAGGGGGASTTPTAAASSSTGKKRSAKSTRVPASSTKAAPVSKKVQAKATQAASQVLGSSAQHLAPATVQQGGKCTNGQAGCQGGKFTGQFFGQ